MRSKSLNCLRPIKSGRTTAKPHRARQHRPKRKNTPAQEYFSKNKSSFLFEALQFKVLPRFPRRCPALSLFIGRIHFELSSSVSSISGSTLSRYTRFKYPKQKQYGRVFIETNTKLTFHIHSNLYITSKCI